ncbi:MAG: hypothetical protein IJ952_09100, partial [Alistipes sp.]|nr:hypothetical protein [Alistipes sp.]
PKCPSTPSAFPAEIALRLIVYNCVNTQKSDSIRRDVYLKKPVRPQAKNGQKNMQQKNQYPTAKGRTPIRSQKNNADSPVRHNSQK